MFLKNFKIIRYVIFPLGTLLLAMYIVCPELEFL